MKSLLESAVHLHVQQAFEGFEIVLGWESRNKYRIFNEKFEPIAFAAEEATGMLGAIFRQMAGHWRTFRVTVFGVDRQPEYTLEFPFRWFFKTLIVRNREGEIIGHVQQEFAFFRKKFELFGRKGRKLAYINSTFFKFWTFDVFARKKIASIQKKWSGALSEFFTDRDNFIVHFEDDELAEETRALLLATCLMVDIVYFTGNKGAAGLPIPGVGDLLD